MLRCMDSVLIITISGEDRPGLVGELASVVAEHGGNWEHCRMADLSGRFAGLLQVRVAEADEAQLNESLCAIQGLEVTVAKGRSVADSGARPFHLEVVGSDHPGIVRDIFKVVAAADVNVEELSTNTLSAPESGGMLFKARARLAVPVETDLQTVIREVEAIAQDLLVDVQVTE